MPSSPSRMNAAVAREDVEDGTASGPGAIGKSGAQPFQDLPRAPAVAGVFGEDLLHELVGGLMWTRARCPTVIVETAGAVLPIAV